MKKYHKYVMQVTTIVRIRVLKELIELLLQKGDLVTVYEQAKYEAFRNTVTNYLMALFCKGTKK